MAAITSNRNTDTIIICVICEAKKRIFLFHPNLFDRVLDKIKETGM